MNAFQIKIIHNAKTMCNSFQGNEGILAKNQLYKIKIVLNARVIGKKVQ